MKWSMLRIIKSLLISATLVTSQGILTTNKSNSENYIKGVVELKAEKKSIYNAIFETPKDTDYVVVINGFVGTKLVKEYLDDVVKGQFRVDVIRGYSNSGKWKEENEVIAEYNKATNNKASIVSLSKKTHMKSNFWFNKNNELIRVLVGSANFSHSAVYYAPDYKEIQFALPQQYLNTVGRDLYCGGVQATQQENMLRNFIQLCEGFDKDNPLTYKSKNIIKPKKQLEDLVKPVPHAKHLIVLTGDGGSETIEQYLDLTKENGNLKSGIKLDVFVGNTNAWFDEKIEQRWNEKGVFGNRLGIYREYKAVSKFILNRAPKTHTKIYAWYNDNYEIVRFMVGSANFTKTGVYSSEAFREVLMDLDPVTNQEHFKDKVCGTMQMFELWNRARYRLENYC